MTKLANLLSSLQTASLNKTTSIIINYNLLVLKACALLEDLGYISGFTIINSKKLKVYLRYYKNASVIRSARLFSKPSSRVYFKRRLFFKKNFKNSLQTNSFIIVSTSRSPMLFTDLECHLMNSGGEPLFLIS